MIVRAGLKPARNSDNNQTENKQKTVSVISDTWKTHKQVCVGKLQTERTEIWENSKKLFKFNLDIWL